MSNVRFGKRIDLQGNEILNAIVQRFTGTPTPTAAQAGRMIYNTADNRFYVCTGSAWELRATNADALAGFTPAQLRDRSTHTGQQAASSISDLATTVQGYPLSAFAAATAAIKAGGQRIINVADGTATTDAVNLQQLDIVRNIALSAATGTAIKAPVIAVAEGNINLSSVPAIDGVTIPTDGRFLAAGQTDATQNGIYVKQANGSAVRAGDATASGTLAPGTQVFATQGTNHADTSWAIVSDAAITIGTTAQQWAKVPGTSANQQLTFGAGLLKTGNDVTVRAGLGITVGDGSVAIDTAVVPRKVSQNVPAAAGAAANAINITHGLATSDIIEVTTREISSGDRVYVGWRVDSTNVVQLDFGADVAAGTYRVSVLG
ncbi:hypothetical protein SEA_DALANDE_105 [Gordonia phage DalanDe]|nr:hypothetical protein SEA_DALANDE_105 [Gordonia phage DalanDe]